MAGSCRSSGTQSVESVPAQTVVAISPRATGKVGAMRRGGRVLCGVSRSRRPRAILGIRSATTGRE